jgi:hypothetical protein
MRMKRRFFHNHQHIAQKIDSTAAPSTAGA